MTWPFQRPGGAFNLPGVIDGNPPAAPWAWQMTGRASPWSAAPAHGQRSRASVPSAGIHPGILLSPGAEFDWEPPELPRPPAPFEPPDLPPEPWTEPQPMPEPGLGGPPLPRAWGPAGPPWLPPAPPLPPPIDPPPAWLEWWRRFLEDLLSGLAGGGTPYQNRRAEEAVDRWLERLLADIEGGAGRRAETRLPLPLRGPKRAALSGKNWRRMLKLLLQLYVGGPIDRHPWPPYITPASESEILQLCIALTAVVLCRMDWPKFIEWLHERVLHRLQGTRHDPSGRRVVDDRPPPTDPEMTWFNWLRELALGLLDRLPRGYPRGERTPHWVAFSRIAARH